MKIDLYKIPSFGIAGNFAGHLEQAGEASDFEKIKSSFDAPKAIFPTYIPSKNPIVPEFLSVFPFDDSKIILPANEDKVQIEPECAILFNVYRAGSKIINLEPEFFTASNDVSIRKIGASKISLKKNWGKSSKGLSKNFIKIDFFSNGSILDRYRIACFLFRDGSLFEYGEESLVQSYNYLYERLIDWCIDKLNFQKDTGTVENIASYLDVCENPQKLLISIGATRYTDYGMNNFLKTGDLSIVMLYPYDRYSKKHLETMILQKNFSAEDIAFLVQEAVFC